MFYFARRIRNLLTLIYLWIAVEVRLTLGKPVIHVIGDSHSLLFQHHLIKIHYLGAVTAFNLINNNSTSKGREKLFQAISKIRNKKDIILLVFGEIDCRIHIYYQHNKSKGKISMRSLIRNTAQNYIEAANEIKKLGFQVAVFNVMPPGSQKNIYKYPYYAPWETRLKITKMMNEELNKLCKQNNIHFINIYDSLVNPDHLSEKKYRKKEYIFDSVHLNTKIVGLMMDKIWTLF